MTDTNEKKQLSQNNQAEVSSYRSIFKATSIFGGVQIWRIIIQIVKQKAIALLLGTTGMGICGLYMSSIKLIQDFTSMGLDKSAVKNVAEANGAGNDERIRRVVTALRKLVWVTGILGMVAVIILSPLLSKSSFGNYDYTIPFIILSVSLLVQQLTSGQLVVLQGLRKIKQLALANVLGAFFGLVISIPIYYLWGVKGIVPTLILDAVTTFSLSYYFTRKLQIKSVQLSLKETVGEGKSMVGMGLALSLNGILVSGVAYVINIFIARIGGTAQVGLYAAGTAIVNSYVGMVFSAMSTDYYPRLSGMSQDNEKCRIVINQQAEIATLIIAPLASVFIVAAPLIVIILYSNDFLSIVPFMQLAMLGMLFKVGSWSISYLFLAKGDVKTFIKNEIGIKIFNLPLYLILYYLLGLKGIGLGFLINYCVYFGLVYIMARKKYQFHLSKEYINLFVCMFLLMSVVSLVVFFLKQSLITYIISAIIIIVCCFFSYKELNKRLSLRSFIKEKIRKKH